jgi:isochorismate synthase
LKRFSHQDTASHYHRAISEGLAVALYRLPDAKVVEYIYGAARRRINKGERAYVFAPFDPSQKPYFIKESGSPSPPIAPDKKKVKSTTKKQFTTLVRNIIAGINTGPFKKIVAARVLAINRPGDFDPLSFFEKLCAAYPHVFVSLTFIPGVGLWIGASPEVLASEKGGTLTTYSLAGTKALADNTMWSDKEIEEQVIVTDFIQKKLSKITEGSILTKGPYTHKAGMIKHLLTTFTIAVDQKNLWQKVVKSLHPTPAVSGLPKMRSVDFLRANEDFDRRFYAGYLGPVNHNGKTDIFVNLRCIEITEKQILFYAGCGVTQGSDPDMEWLESERKINILKSLI